MAIWAPHRAKARVELPTTGTSPNRETTSALIAAPPSSTRSAPLQPQAFSTR